jgi:hypothetical protein
VSAVMSTDEFETLLVMNPRNHGPYLLWHHAIWHKIEAATVAATIGSVWSGAEWPQHYLPRKYWLELFEVAGYTEDGEPADRPAEPVRLWRGSEHRYRRRFSWTADRDRAEWFANRWAGTG